MISTAEYEYTADVLLFDARWKLSERGEIFFNASYARTDSGYDPLRMDFPSLQLSGLSAADYNRLLALFPNGLPGPGDDLDPMNPANDPPVTVHDYDFSGTGDYSDLEYTELRATLGFRYQAREYLGLFGSVSQYDLEDDEPYLQDADGSVTLVAGGLSWTF